MGSIFIDAPGPRGFVTLKPPFQVTLEYGGGGAGFGNGFRPDAPVNGVINEYVNRSPSGSVALWSNIKSALLQRTNGG